MDKFNQKLEKLQKDNNKKNIINLTNKSLIYIFSTFYIILFIGGLIKITKIQKEIQKIQKETKEKKNEKIDKINSLKRSKDNFIILLYSIIRGIEKQEIKPTQISINLYFMENILNKKNIIISKNFKKKIIENLNYIKQKYPTDKNINNLVNQIINKLNSYDVNPLLAKQK